MRNGCEARGERIKTHSYPYQGTKTSSCSHERTGYYQNGTPEK